MHGGRVKAFSEGLGKGSELTVRLPLLTPRPAAQAAERASSPAAAPSSRCRVLVVDDNVDSAETLALILRTAHHEVLIAHDASSALELLDRHAPSIAFLDMGLPDMDGCMLAQTIRERVSDAIRLVALTGYGANEDRTVALQSGFDHHLTKPADPVRVLELVQQQPARAKQPTH